MNAGTRFDETGKRIRVSEDHVLDSLHKTLDEHVRLMNRVVDALVVQADKLVAHEKTIKTLLERMDKLGAFVDLSKHK